MRELKAIAHYIAEKFHSKKIVEVGVGHVPDVAVEVKRLSPSSEVVVTDVREQVRLPEPITFVRDDATKPDLRIYRGALLIYAIPRRPSSSLTRSNSLEGWARSFWLSRWRARASP